MERSLLFNNKSIISNNSKRCDWCGRDAPVPRDKMIRPEDIAQAALLPFRMSALACPTDIVVRPSHKLT